MQFIRRHLKVSTLSLRTIVLLGFTAVTLPLALVLASSLMNVERVSVKGVDAVKQVAKVVYTSQQLTSLLNSMERTTSQYQVLSDPELQQQYLQLRDTFLLLIKDTQDSPHSRKLAAPLENLLKAESELYNRVMLKQQEITLKEIQNAYSSMHSDGQRVFQLNSDIIAEEINAIEQSADEIEAQLLHSTFIFPLTLLLAILFLRLINRPLNQLMPQLKRLETGDLNQPVMVTGAIDIANVARTIDKMRAKLLQLEEQKRLTLQHISHELKTPLAAIREGTELLYDGTSGELNDTQAHIAGILRSSTERLQKLIEALIDLNIIIAADLPDHQQYCDIVGVIQGVIEAHSLEVKTNGLVIDGPTDKKRLIPFYEEHCRIVMDNVLSNAIKFSPEKGTIRIAFAESAEFFAITVSDEGPGIPDGEKEQVFELFYQASNRPTTKVKGSGMGLTLTREILNKYAAAIQLLSNDKAPGCKVIITLPLENEKN